MPRIYFDVMLKDGSSQQDRIGLIVPDAIRGLHEGIDAVSDLDPGQVERLTVRDDRGVLAVINVFNVRDAASA